MADGIDSYRGNSFLLGYGSRLGAMLSEADFQLQQLVEVDSYINQPLHAIEYGHGGYGNRQGWSMGAHYGT